MKRIFSEAGLENYSPIQLKRSPMQMVIRDEIARIIQNFRNTQKYKKSALRALNILMYATFSNSYPPSWSSDDGSAPVVSYFSKLSEEDIRAEVGDYYLDYVDVKWIDIPESSSSDDASIAPTKSKKLAQNSIDNNSKSASSIPDDKIFDSLETIDLDEALSALNDKSTSASSSQSKEAGSTLGSNHLDTIYDEVRPNSKPEDLWLNGPAVPQIDTSKIWRRGIVDDTELVIYHSLPEIPTRQCEISITTDSSKLAKTDLMKLYPDCMFYTRPMILYSESCGLKMHKTFGGIIPIKGFTQKQIIDNIVKYPVVTGMTREGKKHGRSIFVEFEKFIEIDGELYKTTDMIDKLPDLKTLKPSWSIIAEYVVRRYLLERDILHIDHKYKMYGTLDPYLTLFMPSQDYVSAGHKDVVAIAKHCVESRVSYLQSRSPIIRRLEENA